ncbi:MAG TPA: hypothetical protein DEQ14_02495 [Treponema sp.]|nr:hypothetical protein [Treponema sp.]
MVSNEIKKGGTIPASAWVSRLWAQHNMLPEHLKQSFINLAQNIALEANQPERTGVFAYPDRAD